MSDKQFNQEIEELRSEVNHNLSDYDELETEIAKLNKEIDKLNVGNATDLLDSVLNGVSSSLLGPIGLQMGDFKTIDSNAEHFSKINSGEIGSGDLRKDNSTGYAKAQIEAKSREINGKLTYENGYTGINQVVDTGIKYDANNLELEHIIPISEKEKNMWNHLWKNQQDRVKEANDKNNTTMITRGDNSYGKKDKDLMVYTNMKIPSTSKQYDPSKPNQTYGEKYGHNPKLIKEQYSKAKWNEVCHNAKATGGAAFRITTKMALGMLVSEISQIILKAMIHGFKQKFNSFNERIDFIIDEIKAGFENFKNNLGAFFTKIIGSSFTQILNEVATFLARVFLGTIKNIVKIVSKTVHSIVGAIQILFDVSKTWDEKFFEINKLLATTVAVIFGIIGIELLTKAIPILEPFKSEIEIILSACLTALITYWFDSFRARKIELQKNLLKNEKIDKQLVQNDKLFKAYVNCMAMKQVCYNKIFDKLKRSLFNRNIDGAYTYINWIIKHNGGIVYYKTYEEFLVDWKKGVVRV